MTKNLIKTHNHYLKILMVESDISREIAMREWLDRDHDLKIKCTSIGNIVMSIIERDHEYAWHGIMLDYDLDEFREDVSYKSGWDVAKTIAKNTDKDVPIYIHSMNPDESQEMFEFFKDEGFTSVTKTTFAEITRERFLDWLQECRTRVAESIGDMPEMGW